MKAKEIHMDDVANMYRIGYDFIILEDLDEDENVGKVLKSGHSIIIQCTRGCAELSIGLISILLSEGQITYFRDECLLELKSKSDDFNATALLLSDAFLCEMDLDYEYFHDKTGGEILHSTNHGSFEKFIGICKDIIKFDTNPNKKKVIRLLTNAYLIGLSHFGNEIDNKLSGNTSSAMLTKKFLSILRSQDAFLRPVKYYADSLNVTVKHLTFASKQSTGHSASYWIHRALVLQSKHLLSLYDYPIYIIAERLGFSNQSAFGRFFKQEAGISPSEYRRQLLRHH